MSSNADHIVDWLFASLAVKSALFHVGQYCGNWQASTAGHRRASFHLVLSGQCWLHIPALGEQGARRLLLESGDAVFLLRDMPHCVSPDPDPPAAGQETRRAGEMLALNTASATPDSVGIACGFFGYGSTLDEILLSLLPDVIVARRDGPSPGNISTIFQLILAEVQRDFPASSTLVARLTDLLFIYTLKALKPTDGFDAGIWSLIRHDTFSPLIRKIIETPGEPWTTDAMADFLHMSRARFCKRFTDLSGQSPGQFVTLLRMKVAADMLRDGSPTLDIAEHVGYKSESAFAQAFKRTTGLQPGVWRRQASTTRDDFAENEDAGALRATGRGRTLAPHLERSL
jgi:AraC-like DNA-binding protein